VNGAPTGTDPGDEVLAGMRQMPKGEVCLPTMTAWGRTTAPEPSVGSEAVMEKSRTINITEYRNAKDDVNPAKNRTFGGIIHDWFVNLFIGGTASFTPAQRPNSAGAGEQHSSANGMKLPEGHFISRSAGMSCWVARSTSPCNMIRFATAPWNDAAHAMQHRPQATPHKRGASLHGLLAPHKHRDGAH